MFKHVDLNLERTTVFPNRDTGDAVITRGVVVII